MEEKPQFQVVLPTRKTPQWLSNETVIPIPQFLVGYRNLITQQGELRWALVKSKASCGRAFVFNISEETALNIQQYKKEGEFIETVGNSYIFLFEESRVQKPTERISAQNMQDLLTQIGGITKINLNLVKCSFDSEEQYQSAVPSDVENQLFPQAQSTKVKEQLSQKTVFFRSILSGDALKQLPQVSKENGCWLQTKIELKLTQE